MSGIRQVLRLTRDDLDQDNLRLSRKCLALERALVRLVGEAKARPVLDEIRREYLPFTHQLPDAESGVSLPGEKP